MMTYEQLMEIAKSDLLSVDTAPERLPAPLVYVLETAGGHIHTVVNDDYQPVIEDLTRSQDAVVTRVLALWKNGCVDVPSYAFRRALLAMSGANARTEILVLTGEGYVARPLGAMM